MAPISGGITGCSTLDPHDQVSQARWTIIFVFLAGMDEGSKSCLARVSILVFAIAAAVFINPSEGFSECLNSQYNHILGSGILLRLHL